MKGLQGLWFKSVFLFYWRQWQIIQWAHNECQNTNTKNPSQKNHTHNTNPTPMCVSHAYKEGREEMRQWSLVFAVQHFSASYLTFFYP